ncbi:MAG: ATP-binding protein [Janthinobacterium lividum]
MPTFPNLRLHWWPLALLLAALSFGASWMADRYRELPGGPEPLHPDAAGLQRLVGQAAATATREAALVAHDYQPPAAPDFARLRGQCSYPTFVNVDSTLVAWSTSGPEPTASDWADRRPERLASTPLGEFLVVRQALGRVRVLVFVPLARHYGINNRYLRAGAEPALLQGLDVRVQAAPPAPGQASGRMAALLDSAGHYLFTVVQEPGGAVAERTLPLALLLLGMVAWVAAGLGLAAGLRQRGRVALAVAAALGSLLLLRGALLYWELPFAWLELPLFDPRVYAVSTTTPSLGDLLLNSALALLTASGVVVLAQHYDLPGQARRAPPFRWGPVAWLLLLAMLLRQYTYCTSTFSNNQLNLDVTQSIQVSGFRLVLLLAVLLHTAAFVLIFLLLTQLLAPDLRRLRQAPLRWLGPVGGLLLLLLGTLLRQPALVLPALTILYLVLVRTSGLDEPQLPPGSRYLAVLLGLGLAAASGSLAEYGQFERQLVQDKQRLANNLLIDNDLQGEFLLGQRLRLLGNDPTVARLLAASPERAEALRRRISRQYLSSYFDKYEENIELFNPEGRPVGNEEGDTLSFGQLRERLGRLASPTDQPGVYLLKSDNSFSSRRYVAVVPIRAAPAGGIGPPTPIGTILVTLSLKQLSSYSVLPELLVDQKFFQPGLATDLSYAGYLGGQLVYSQGEFDYANMLPVGLLNDPAIYSKGLIIGGFHHLAVRDSQGRTVVVTTATYSLTDGLSNFSVLLLFNVLAWLLVLGGALLVRRDWRTAGLNFSTRIQLLLNVGVLLPLLVVSIATASQLTASYRRDLHRFYERRGHLALESLLRRREQLADTTARASLVALVRNVATLTETDLNLYDVRGQLLVSSQPLIFEAGLLGPLLNPQAVSDLRDRGLSRTLLTERAGSLSFTALYLPVRTDAADGLAGPVIGYVGIPFFDSQKELDGKLSDLLTTTLNIFTLMFLFFLTLALVATRQLTAPLKLLTQRLNRTTLTGQNEVLDYRSSDDEIGLLVREYNTMLGKLEESKRELAAQEKEAAWREMARQVAHEIKNPLTPMKLSLQYLQKAMAERRPNTEELIGRLSQTLITQIDVLSDIATSFSTFTNLPTMRPTRLDVGQVLRQCTDLFRQSEGAEEGELRLQLPPGDPYFVFADESLLVRTFNNLLLNALQAVPPGRAPRQEVSLAPDGHNRVLITIRDNGAGMAEEVRDKVFKPNFTTKITGSGIGLAVAKRGIESAGGRIWFETQEDEGTSFFIELPLAG